MTAVAPGAAPDDEGLRAFFAKAAAREPLLEAATHFAPAAERRRFMAWAALLAEWRECAFELSDPRVTAVKAGWWADELAGMARGAARHPVSRVLVQTDAPWAAVREPLLDAALDLDPPGDAQEALSRLSAFADAIIAVEHALFGIAVGDAEREAQRRALAVHWLRHRLETGLEAQDRARVPLQMFARHGVRRERLADVEAEPLRRDWAAWLRDALPALTPQTAAFHRLLALDADRRQLKHRAAGVSSPSQGHRFAHVWRAWRLARNAAFQPSGTAIPRT